MGENKFFANISTDVDGEEVIKMNMSDELAQNIHSSYVSAAHAININGTQVETHLQQELELIETHSETDQRILSCFKDKLDASIRGRIPTFKITELVEAVLHVCLYIIIWLNAQHNLKIDAIINARRKAIESELAKNLSLADANDPTPLMDRFGIRIITHEGIHDLCLLVAKTINVLCSPYSKDREEFLKFAKENFNELQLATIKHVFRLPFTTLNIFRRDDPADFDSSKYPDIELPTSADFELVKHLAANIKYYLLPKKNGYQSIHIILALDNTSPELAGLQIELQFRTWAMDNHAENNISASHDVHKDRVKEYEKIFTLSNEELKGVSIRFFNSYKNVHNDRDGIHFAKEFNCRRMNTISF